VRLPLAGYVPAMSNPYGITLDREWAEWAAKIGVSPTIAAALLLISRSRPLPEIVVRLTPGELEEVVGVIGRWPECFPPGTLATLKSVRLTRSPEPSAVCVSTEGTCGLPCPAATLGPQPPPSSQRAAPTLSLGSHVIDPCSSYRRL